MAWNGFIHEGMNFSSQLIIPLQQSFSYSLFNSSYYPFNTFLPSYSSSSSNQYRPIRSSLDPLSQSQQSMQSFSPLLRVFVESQTILEVSFHTGSSSFFFVFVWQLFGLPFQYWNYCFPFAATERKILQKGSAFLPWRKELSILGILVALLMENTNSPFS